MQISCERCGTTYALDDKLIPATGAPVQCTRCGHVFTARRPGTSPAAPVKPAAAPAAPPKPAAPPPAAAAPRQGTVMFGGAGAPAPANPYAAPAAPRPPAPAPVAAPAAPAAPAARQGTQVFGSAGAQAPLAGGAAKPGPVPVFGGPAAAPAPSAPAAKPSLFAPESLAAPAHSTMQFGAVGTPAAAPASPARPTPAPSPSLDEQLERHGTMQFGAVAFTPSTPAAPSLAAPAAEAGPAPSRTQQFGIPPAAKAAAQPPGDAAAPAWMSAPAAQANQPSWMAPAGAQAPTKPPHPTPNLAEEPPRPALARELPAMHVSAGPATLDLQEDLMRKQRRGPMLLLAVSLGLAAALAGYLLLKNRAPSIDPELIEADEAALLLLKRDDLKSLEQAITAWDALEKRAPELVSAKANQLMAHALINADLRDEIRRLTASGAAAEREMKKLEDKKATPDWLNRANAKREEIVGYKAQADRLIERASAHDDRAGALLKEAQAIVEKTGRDSAVLHRAAALYYGLKGEPSAERLAASYRAFEADEQERTLLHDDARAFADLAIAALHAQPRLSADKHAQGIAAAQEALKKDSRLVRAQLLIVKLHLGVKDYAAAKHAVAELLAVAPGHEAGSKLKAELERLDVAEAKEKGAESPE